MSNLDDLKNVRNYLTFDDVLLLPKYSEITPQEVCLETVLFSDLTLKIPILSAPMDSLTESGMLLALGKLGGMGVLHRNLSIHEQASQLKIALDAGINASAAVGFGPDFEERVSTLAKLNPSAICIDSAHAHTKNILQATRFIKQHYPHLSLIAGNVATYEGAKALFEAGADLVKVGMGSGSICTTRIMSGVGVPALSAIVDCAKAAREFNRTLIADGGIRNSGDIVKAIAAGASAVMLGSLLAGTDESVGDIIEHDGHYYKAYRGMGSVHSMVNGSANRYGQNYTAGEAQNLVPEGVEGLIPSRGPLKEWVHQILGGIRSGCGYTGADSIKALQEKAQFITITTASFAESHPHTIVLKS
ncbi:MAG: IMP dehydrogenase [Parachlamydiaceae bacterium]|nr:IMP dehydrogenase [Parachlamydiaceae bacterium]